MTLHNALIRIHHITSRKKIAHLRASASNNQIYALLRSGGCPGIMYCEGGEAGVKEWVASVQRLRYKDYQLVVKPGAKSVREALKVEEMGKGKLEEVDSVKEFGARMERLGVWTWWRKGMGYVHDDG